MRGPWDREMTGLEGGVAVEAMRLGASAAYRRLLAAAASPEEREAGLKGWGSGEARIVTAQLLDDDGEERVQLAAGEPARRGAASGGAAGRNTPDSARSRASGNPERQIGQ